MNSDKAKEEVISVLKNLKPNEVVGLSADASKLLFDTIRKLNFNVIART